MRGFFPRRLFLPTHPFCLLRRASDGVTQLCPFLQLDPLFLPLYFFPVHFGCLFSPLLHLSFYRFFFFHLLTFLSPSGLSRPRFSLRSFCGRAPCPLLRFPASDAVSDPFTMCLHPPRGSLFQGGGHCHCSNFCVTLLSPPPRGKSVVHPVCGHEPCSFSSPSFPFYLVPALGYHSEAPPIFLGGALSR